jgi:hypothetical protein
MPTVSELIHSSFRLIGAIAAGETLETAELNDAFVSLNQMISSWNTEGASLPGRQQSTTALVVGTNNYALTTRPIKIDAASAAISGIDCPLEIVDSPGWEAITEKAATAVILRKLFCDYRYPASKVYIWPTPRMTGSLELWTYDPLPAFATTGETVNLPPGYEAALRLNFAVLIEPEYPRSAIDPLLPSQAANYKASIVQLNTSNQMRSAPVSAPIAASTGQTA